MSLAIVEAQKQRPASGCVGVLFLHLLDWNRSLAKKNKKRKKNNKKLFSMRTVLPPLLKRTSNNPSPLSSPLHPKTSLEKREEAVTMEGNRKNAMVQPSIVARLMGLESMPISPHERPENSQKSLKQDNNARPQKVRKTSNGSGSFITSSNPTRLKGHEQNQKMVSFSPSRSPSRSPRARLVQAAAKILEPGMRPRLSPSRLRYQEEEKEEITVSSLETEFSFPYSNSDTQEFVVSTDSSNLEREAMIVNNTETEVLDHAFLERKSQKLDNSRERIKANCAGKTRNLVEKRPNIQRTVRKQSITTNNSIINKNSLSKSSSNCEKMKTGRPKLNTESEIINRKCTSSYSNRDVVKKKTEFNTVKSRGSKNRVSLEKVESSIGEIKGEDISRRLTCSILEKLVSEINEEEGNIYQKTLFQEEIGQPSPISILESSFSNDSFSFDSPNNSSEGKYFVHSTESLNQVSSRLNYNNEIASNFELLIINIFCHQEKKYSVNKFLVELSEFVMDSFNGDLTGEKECYRLTNFMFDCIVECMDLKYRFLGKSGFNIWDSLFRLLSKDCLTKEICKEIKEWNDMRGKGLDIITEIDFRNSKFNWCSFEFEGFEVGVEIERDLLCSLVDEFVFDLC